MGRMDARKLRKAPPVEVEYKIDPTPYSTSSEVKNVVRRAAQVSDNFNRNGQELCFLAASLIVKRGPELIGVEIPPARCPEGVPAHQFRPKCERDRGIDWIAGQIRRSRSHFYRLARLGLVRNAVVAQCATPALRASDRALTPLALLLPASCGNKSGTDRSDEIAPTFGAALEAANRDDRSLASHIREQVDSLLGRVKDEPEEAIRKQLDVILKRLRGLEGQDEAVRLLVKTIEALDMDVPI